MKTQNELRSIVEGFWNDNQNVAEPILARDFQTLIDGIEGVDIVRAKDVKEGLTFHIESASTKIEGILHKNGRIDLKDESHGPNWLNTHMIG
jgi:hypothetical protein